MLHVALTLLSARTADDVRALASTVPVPEERDTLLGLAESMETGMRDVDWTEDKKVHNLYMIRQTFAYVDALHDGMESPPGCRMVQAGETVAVRGYLFDLDMFAYEEAPSGDTWFLPGDAVAFLWDFP